MVEDEINSPAEEVSLTINAQSHMSITWLLSASCFEGLQLAWMFVLFSLSYEGDKATDNWSLSVYGTLGFDTDSMLQSGSFSRLRPEASNNEASTCSPLGFLSIVALVAQPSKSKVKRVKNFI